MNIERTSARGIILEDDKAVLIYRKKGSAEYWVTPGGGVEKNENPEETIVREMKEELGIDIVVEKPLLEVFDDVNGVQQHDYYYLCKKINGSIDSIGGPEAERQNDNNIYRPESIGLNTIHDINIVPLYVKALIVKVLSGENVDFSILDIRL